MSERPAGQRLVNAVVEHDKSAVMLKSFTPGTGVKKDDPKKDK